MKRFMHQVSSRSALAVIVGISILVGCGPSSYGRQITSYASWSAQLSLAQQEAKEIDKDAVVMWISSKFKDCKANSQEPERIMFIFLQPSGDRFSVIIQDTDPPTILDVMPHFDSSGQPVEERVLQAYAAALDSVKVGPREICQETLQEGQALSTTPSVSIFFDRNQMKQFGIAAVWSVWYDDLNTERSLNLLVSPSSGDILQQKRFP